MEVQKYRSIERIVDNIGDKRERHARKYASFRQHMHITDKSSQKVVITKNLKALQVATVIVIIVTNVSYKHL